jgi:hypothetical protein
VTKMASRRVPKKVLRDEFVSKWNTDPDILEILEDKDDEFKELPRKRRRTTKKAPGDVAPKQSRKRVAPVSVSDGVALGAADTIVGPSGLSGFTPSGFTLAVDASDGVALGAADTIVGPSGLSGFTPAVDAEPTELASVGAGGDPARHIADTGSLVRKSRKRGTGPEPVRNTRTGASQLGPIGSAGDDPAEWSDIEIGDGLIELLENRTSDGLSVWDEEAELPESDEAGEEPVEKAP